jgi:hypothetical protein
MSVFVGERAIELNKTEKATVLDSFKSIFLSKNLPFHERSVAAFVCELDGANLIVGDISFVDIAENGENLQIAFTKDFKYGANCISLFAVGDHGDIEYTFVNRNGDEILGDGWTAYVVTVLTGDDDEGEEFIFKAGPTRKAKDALMVRDEEANVKKIAKMREENEKRVMQIRSRMKLTTEIKRVQQLIIELRTKIGVATDGEAIKIFMTHLGNMIKNQTVSPTRLLHMFRVPASFEKKSPEQCESEWNNPRSMLWTVQFNDPDMVAFIGDQLEQYISQV